MIQSVVREFAVTPTNIEALGNAGGFSGSAIWKITADEKQFCLKRWPESFSDRERIDWIHRVIVFAAANGCPEVIKPLASQTGTTHVEQDGNFWRQLLRIPQHRKALGRHSTLSPDSIRLQLDITSILHRRKTPASLLRTCKTWIRRWPRLHKVFRNSRITWNVASLNSSDHTLLRSPNV